MVEYNIKLKLSSTEKKRIGEDLISKIRSARAAMKQLLDDLKTWDKLYEGKLPSRDFPWADCSNNNIPMIQSIIDTYHAHINEVVLGVRPMILVMPPPFASDPELKTIAANVQDMLDAVLFDQMDIENTIDDLTQMSIRTPAAISKMAWREEYRRQTTATQEIEQETGQPTTKFTTQDVPNYKGPRLEYVDLRNFVLFPLTYSSIEQAQIVGDRYRLRPDQIKRRVKDGYFDKDADSVLDLMDTEASTAEDTEDEEQADYEGIDKLTDYDQAWFWEVIAPYSKNDDGLTEDCVFTLHASTGTIVRATRFPYFHGMRYYIPMRVYRRPGRFFARCLPQILEGCQKEINALHNQGIDAVTLSMVKAFKGRRGSGIEPDTLVMSPGSTILLDDPVNDLVEFNINPIVPGVDREAIIRDWSERASGINDLSLGRVTEEQKTAKEVAIVNAEGGIRFSDVIRRLQESILAIGKQVIGLLYQFMSDEELAQYQLTRDMLLVPWKLLPHGNTGTANQVQQRQEAMVMYQTLMNNPLVAQDPRKLYRITQDLLHAFDREDVDAYIGTLDEATQLFMMNMQAKQAEIAISQELAAAHSEEAAIGRRQGANTGGMARPGGTVLAAGGGGTPNQG